MALVEALAPIATANTNPSNATRTIQAGVQEAWVPFCYYRANSTDPTAVWDTAGAAEPMELIANWDRADASGGSVWHIAVFRIQNPTNRVGVNVQITVPGTGDIFHGVQYLLGYDVLSLALANLNFIVNELAGPNNNGTVGPVDTEATPVAAHLFGAFVGEALNLAGVGQTVQQNNTSDGASSGVVTVDAPGTPNDTLAYTEADEASYVIAYVEALVTSIDFEHLVGDVDINGQVHDLVFPSQLTIPVTNGGAPVANETNLQYAFWLRSVWEANIGGVLPAPALQGDDGATDGAGNFILDTSGIFVFNDIVVGVCREPDSNEYAVDQFAVS